MQKEISSRDVIHVADLEPGIYVVRIIDEKGMVSTTQMVKY